MTLVFRSPKLVQVIPNQNPGPGAYKIPDKIHNHPLPSSSFSSKVCKSPDSMEEHDVGPTTYFRQTYQQSNQSDNSLSVFKSKIDRFGNNSSSAKMISKQKQFAKEFNDLMKKQKKEHSYKGKLIDLKLKKEKWEKINDLQILPSIPSMEHSYGYRVDQNTNKLVNNYNPKVIFTQTAKSDGKDDFYFQHSLKSAATTKTFLINSSSKRNNNELQHQLNNPNLNAYNSDKYFTIQDSCNNAKSSNNFQSNLPRFSENSPTKKELLVLNKLKKQFQAYIDDKDLDLEKLQQSKLQSNSAVIVPSKLIEKTQTQCFLSKVTRFPEEKATVSNSFKKEDIKLMEEKPSKEAKEKSPILQQKKKQPFDLCMDRFKPRHKQVLGPGTYQLKDETFTHGISLKQSCDRFQTRASNTSEIPGPGSYEVSQSEEKEKAKFTFNKYRNNEYFNEIKTHKNKEHSMEDLYQQVGKHMNYLNKIEKLQTKKKQNRINNHQKTQQYLNLDRISQAKKILKEKLTISSQESEEKENKVIQKMPISPKYVHLYQYVKPDPIVSAIGPGYYQIRTTLDKKSFNKT